MQYVIVVVSFCGTVSLDNLACELRHMLYWGQIMNYLSVWLSLSCSWSVCTRWANKKRATLLLFICSPIIDRFSKFFYWQTL